MSTVTVIAISSIPNGCFGTLPRLLLWLCSAWGPFLPVLLWRLCSARAHARPRGCSSLAGRLLQRLAPSLQGAGHGHPSGSAGALLLPLLLPDVPAMASRRSSSATLPCRSAALGSTAALLTVAPA